MQQCQVGVLIEKVEVDILGPFPWSNSGNQYAHLTKDYFTRWREGYMVPYHSTATTFKKLVEEFFCHFRMTEELHSDLWQNFKSQVVCEICKQLGIAKTHP